MFEKLTDATSTKADLTTTLEAFSKTHAFASLAHLGLLAASRTKASNRLSVLVASDKAMKRLTVLQQMIQKSVSTGMLAKCKASDAMGKRFERCMQPMREMVIEHRKLSVVVSAEQLQASEEYRKCNGQLEEFETALFIAERKKFLAQLNKAFGPFVDTDKALTALIPSASIALAVGQRSFAEYSWSGIALTQEGETAANDLLLERGKFLQNLITGLGVFDEVVKHGTDSKKH